MATPDPPATATAPATHGKPVRRFGRYVLWAVLVCAVGIGLWLLLKVLFKPKPTPPPPPIPVVTAVAQSSDVPIYLTGLGAVQAYNTVTIHTRVDGTLLKVAFIEGQDVKAGELLAKIDPQPFQAQLEQVAAAKARDEALLVNARHDLQRYQTLVQEDSSPVQQRDTQVALVAQDAATVQNDQAQIDYAKVQLAYTSITSPIDGRTGVRLVDVGNIVHAADTNGLVVVTQIEPISVLFTLPEDDFEAVNQQMAKGQLTVTASSRGDSKVLGTGTVLLINNQIDPTTGTVQLKATFPNTDHALWPGQFVDAKLLVQTRQHVVTMPTAAVQRGPKGLYAYVVAAGDKAQMRTIKISTDNTGSPTTMVESGIAAGDRVVVDGQLKLKSDSRVKVVPAAAASQ
ncbi:MAG TPA: efflux RND transporter periplasmic adaptor subunit [Xanthomonadaceae bacterium]|jgi:RND family efflux transporter MFP subunit|nr:efflux RND transporter periplasmic adaptor subunit [Xanthomonadaceae bacterium]